MERCVSKHQCTPVTKFTVMAGVVTQCPCGIVHRVEHKTIVESPIERWNDPQVTFEEYMENAILNALQDEEADHWAANENDDGSEF